MEKPMENYYSALYELSATVNSVHAPEFILKSIAEGVAKAIGAKACALMLLSPDKKVLYVTATYGLSDWYVRKGPVLTDKSIAEALEGKAVAVLNATTDDRVLYRKQAKQEGIVSILCLPIILKDEIIGVIRVYTSEQYYFTLDDEYFVGAAANLGAIALENARLYEQVEKNYEKFRFEMLEWQAALGHEWRDGDEVEPFKKV